MGAGFQSTRLQDSCADFVDWSISTKHLPVLFPCNWSTPWRSADKFFPVTEAHLDAVQIRTMFNGEMKCLQFTVQIMAITSCFTMSCWIEAGGLKLFNGKMMISLLLCKLTTIDCFRIFCVLFFHRKKYISDKNSDTVLKFILCEHEESLLLPRVLQCNYSHHSRCL